MCGPSTSSSGNGGNQSAREKKGARSGSLFGAGPLRGGRGSTTATREKSTFEKQASGTFASFVGSMLGGPVGGAALKNLADRDSSFNVDLTTGSRVIDTSPDGSGDDNSLIPRVAKKPGAEQVGPSAADLAKTKATKLAADKAAADKSRASKAAAAKVKRGSRGGTLLAGRKIAEDKLKTALGQ